MSLFRKNIKLLAVLTICIQISIIFTSIAHNHNWHSFKLFTTEFFDNKEKQSHIDPFADESGLCRINDYVRNSFSVTLTNQIDLSLINGLSYILPFTTQKSFKSFTYCCKFLRSPPLT